MGSGDANKVDVLIVGAGICGLQLGALLAADGQRVAVLEKLSRIGGRAFLWEKDGFVVDNGIHVIRFGPESATARVFRHLGRPLDFVDLGKSHVAFADGRIADFPTSPAGILTTRMMTLRERLATLRLMIELKLRSPAHLLDTSVATWLTERGITGGMRTYLSLVSASMQVCPDLDCSSAGEMLLNVQQVLKRGRSAMYPERGWRYIFDVLCETIERHGEVRTNAAVAEVLVEDGRATGVRLVSDERIEAKRVVISLPCQQLFEVLDESLVPAELAAQCRGLRPTAGVSLDIGFERRIAEDTGLWYLAEPLSFGLFTSNLCPELAPPGKQLLTWLAPSEPSEIADPAQARAIEGALTDAIFRLFPGARDAVAWKRAQHLRVVDGVEVNVDQHRRKRPAFRVPGLADLFLVGDSLAGPGAGGDVGHEGVLLCYREMTGREP